VEIQAQTINSRDIITEYLRSHNAHATIIWQWAMSKPSNWAFRRDDILGSLAVPRRAYKQAGDLLRSLGLMKTITTTAPDESNPQVKTIKSSQIIFFDYPRNEFWKGEKSRQTFIPIPALQEGSIMQKTLHNTEKPSKNVESTPNCTGCENIDHHVITDNTVLEVHEAIPQCECVNNLNGMEQRMMFAEQFEGNMIWQTFDDNSDRRDGNLTRVFQGGIWDVQDTLESLNKRGAGIFMAVNEMKGEKRGNAETKRVRYLVADFDGVDPRKAFTDKPHIIVESSKGKFHCYWKICDCPPDAYQRLQKSIIRKYGSDKAVSDLARVLRVPGFIHQKAKGGESSAPFETKLHYVGSHPPLTYCDAIELFPPEQVKQWSAPKYRTDTGGEFKGEYGVSEGGRNDHIARRIGGMLKRGLDWLTIEHEAMKEAQACSPPLSERETMSIINSMRRYA